MAASVYRCLTVIFLSLMHLVAYSVYGGIAKEFFREELESGERVSDFRKKNGTIKAILEKVHDQEVLKKIRLEMIKQDILSKLQMKCRPPPMYFKRKLIPKPVYEGEISAAGKSQDLATGEGNTGITQIVVPAKKAAIGRKSDSACSGNKMCFAIRFSHRLCDNKIVKSARLRLFKTKPSIIPSLQTISVFEIGEKGENNNLITRRNVPAPTSGWISLEVTALIKQWVSRGSNESFENHYIQVQCDRCFSMFNFETDVESQERPYMIINVRDQKVVKRRKRSLDCRPDTVECCRKLFYVSFAEIGWDDWIIQPLGFDANYCEGSCVGHVSPPNAHRSIMQRISNDKNLKAEFSPCCVATEMRSLSLLYFDEEGFIFKRDIPNMTVDSCGCS